MARSAILVITAVLSGAPSACTISTAPDVRGETWVLDNVSGHGLPTRVADETWVADTIRFDDTGGWSRVEVVVLHAQGAPTQPVRRESGGMVKRGAGRVVLDFSCDDTALAMCAAPDTLLSSAGALVRRANRYGAPPGEDPLFEYEPAGGP